MKRGQAAMEFLMTYGWAILVLLVMIGALSYFGILNPQKVVPERCLFGAGLNCKDYNAQDIGGAAQASFSLENKEGDSIIIQSITVTTAKGSVQYQNATPNCGYGVPMAAVDVDNAWPLFTCPLQAGSSNGKGQRQKFTITILYSKLGGSYNHVTTGQIDSTLN